jgi:hypothetical protein
VHLGNLLARLQDDDNASTALETLGDIVLYTQVTLAGECFGESPGAYTAAAVSRFSGAASDEDWLGVVGGIERSTDPARAALAFMLRWSLRRDATSRDESDDAARECNCGAEGFHRSSLSSDL